MYLEVIISEVISDEKKHNAGSIVLTFEPLILAVMVDNGLGSDAFLQFGYLRENDVT